MNKNIIISTLSFFLILVNSFSQKKVSFEGIIMYENNFKSKIDSISNTQFENAFGKKTKYLLDKNGNYINLFKGAYITIQLFKKNKNTLYTLLTGKDTIYYNKVNKKGGGISNVKRTKNKERVLDKNCDEVTFKTATSKYKYYYNTDYFVDPKLFTTHYLGNWDEIVKITKTFPLKVVLETDSFVMTSTAISIKKGKLEQHLFNLPPNMPVTKGNNNIYIK